MIVPVNCKLGRKLVVIEQSGKREVKVLESLVCKGLTHGVGDVLGADAEDVEQLCGLPAAGNAAHCQPGHNDARLLAHC